MKTPRKFLALALMTALAAAVAAQDRQPDGKDKKKEPDAKAQDAVVRVAKDMKSSVERLEKTDPGDVTRKIQRDIIDGLEELIKQNSKSQGGGGGGGKSIKMKQSEGQKKSSASKEMGQPQDKQGMPKDGKEDGQDQPGRAKGSVEKGPHGQDKDKGQGKDEKEGAAKEGGKDGDKGQAKADDQGKNGGLANVKNDKAQTKPNLAADLNRTDWGHLPLTKRLEMDAYSKERFMPRYDEALQEYYRTIAEQGQKKNE